MSLPSTNFLIEPEAFPVVPAWVTLACIGVNRIARVRRDVDGCPAPCARVSARVEGFINAATGRRDDQVALVNVDGKYIESSIMPLRFNIHDSPPFVVL